MKTTKIKLVNGFFLIALVLKPKTVTMASIHCYVSFVFMMQPTEEVSELLGEYLFTNVIFKNISAIEQPHKNEIFLV